MAKTSIDIDLGNGTDITIHPDPEMGDPYVVIRTMDLAVSRGEDPHKHIVLSFSELEDIMGAVDRYR